MSFNSTDQRNAGMSRAARGTGRAGAAALIAGLCVMVFPAILLGQGSGTTVNVSLTSADQLVVNGVKDLDFGDVLGGFTSKSITLGADAGIFEITGRSNRTISVSLTPATVILENAEGDEMSYTVAAAYQNNGATSPNPGAATPFAGATVSFKIVQQPGPSSQKSAWVFVYGTVVPVGVEALSPGNYTGELTLTAEY